MDFVFCRKRVLRVICLILALLFTLTPLCAAGNGFLYGDVNGDGEIGLQDVTALAKHIAGWENAGSFSFEAADVVCDGILNLNDLTALAKSISGWAITLPILSQRTVFVVSDSTGETYKNGDGSVMTQSDYRDIMGWGYYLEDYFAAPLEFINLSSSGASTRSFLTHANYRILLEEMRKGDYLLIQLGHNDDNTNYKGTDPTLDWHLADPDTCTVEGAALPSYQAILYYRYIAPALERGVTPILASPVTRRNAANGKAYYSRHIPFANALRALCAELELVYLPIMEQTSAYWNEVWEAHGASATASLHAFETEERTSTDNIHLSHYGAYVVAGLYADELYAKVSDLARARLAEPAPFDGEKPSFFA